MQYNKTYYDIFGLENEYNYDKYLCKKTPIKNYFYENKIISDIYKTLSIPFIKEKYDTFYIF